MTSLNGVNDSDTNGCQHSSSKTGNYTSVDNNVDLFSSMISATYFSSDSGQNEALLRELASSIQPSSLQCDQESIPSIENKDCEYLKLVMGFKRTLVLPDMFFSYEMPVCYCPLCVSSSGSDHTNVKGQCQLRSNDHSSLRSEIL